MNTGFWLTPYEHLTYQITEPIVKTAAVTKKPELKIFVT